MDKYFNIAGPCFPDEHTMGNERSHTMTRTPPFCSVVRKAFVAFTTALLVLAIPEASLAAVDPGDGVDWSSLHVVRGAAGPEVLDAAGRRVIRFLPSPDTPKVREAIGAEIVGNGLELDLRGAFAAGAHQVRLHAAVPDPERFSGKDVAFIATLSAPDATRAPTVRGMPSGIANGHSWRTAWDSIPSVWKIPPVAISYETSAPVPPDSTEVFLDLDFLSPGDGKILLKDIRRGNYSILPEEPDASAMPSETSTPGAIRGSAAFWFEVPANNDKPQTLFSLIPSSPNSALGAERNTPPGDGAISLVLDKQRLVWKRNDLLGAGSGRTAALTGPERHHCILTWDESSCTVYIDGEPSPIKRSDDVSPTKAAIKQRQPFAFREGTAALPFYATAGVGITGLRLFSGPMDWKQARQTYQADGGAPRHDYNGWATPWRNPSGPPPPNPALLPPGAKRQLRLIDDVDPVAMARAADPERFRSTGTWRVGSLDGHDYLDAGESLHDRFAIRFQIDPSIELLCFEITYPDDRARTMDLSVTSVRIHWNDYSFDAGIETGLEHPLSGGYAVKRFLYWPKKLDKGLTGDLVFVAMTNGEGEPAAISRIRLYEVVGAALPPAPQRPAEPVEGRVRRFALRYEDPSIAYDFGCGGVAPSRDPIRGIDRVAAYMKFIGANTLVYPGVWYGGLIGDGENPNNPRGHTPHYLREACRRFERDGLSLYASINQQVFPDLRPWPSRRSLTDGSLHGSPITILANGYPNWGYWHFSPNCYNISHPAVQDALLREIDVLLDECAGESAFKGICLDLFNSFNVGWWSSEEAGYNDYSIAAFEKATDLAVAPETDRSDPSRGRAYYDWLRANAWDQWLDWRCDVVADFYARVAERLRSRRPDLEFWVSASPPWRHALARRPDLREPGIIERTLREAGIDAKKLAAIPNLAFGELSMPCWWRDELRKTQRCPEGSREFVRDLPETPGMHAAARRTRYPFALLHDSYYGTDVGAAAPGSSDGRRGDGRLEGDWLDEHDWRVTAFNASGREALRPYATALAHGDLLAFSRGGFLLGTVGTEDVLRPFVANFRALPAVVFQDVALPAGAPTAARLRKATVNGATWYYALNTSHKPCQIALPEPLLDALTGKPVPSPLPLDAYELKALRAP